MKEISKKELMEQLEMGELAYKPKGTQDTSNKIPKFRPIFRPGNETDIPDAWELNPTQTPDGGQLFVPTDCEEVQSFIENNKEWLDELGLTTSLEPMLHACKRTKYQPRNVKAGTTYTPSGVPAIRGEDQTLPARTQRPGITPTAIAGIGHRPLRQHP